MYQYGLLLEDYASNGEFVNDCIFTVMHHAGGELESLITLFQPKILKTFTSIWKSEFEICDVSFYGHISSFFHELTCSYTKGTCSQHIAILQIVNGVFSIGEGYRNFLLVFFFGIIVFTLIVLIQGLVRSNRIRDQYVYKEAAHVTNHG